MWSALLYDNGGCGPPLSSLSIVCISLLLTVDHICAVTFPKNSETETNRANYGVNDDDLGVCLRNDDPLVPCLTSSMVQGIESVGDVGIVDLDDQMRLIQDPDYERRIPKGIIIIISNLRCGIELWGST